MKTKEIDKLTADIIDVILDHQYELSDGFTYYEESDTWKDIIDDINVILTTAIGETKK